MDDQRRAALRRTYLSLGTGELAAAAAFAVVGVTVAAPWIGAGEGRRALWAALVPLLAVLVQGGAYWLLARRWVGVGRMPARLGALYRALRVADAVLLAIALPAVVAWAPGEPTRVVLVVGVWLFGLVEYVNYFVVRLAYPARRWLSGVRQWRTPRLVEDLRDAARRGPGR